MHPDFGFSYTPIEPSPREHVASDDPFSHLCLRYSQISPANCVPLASLHLFPTLRCLPPDFQQEKYVHVFTVNGSACPAQACRMHARRNSHKYTLRCFEVEKASSSVPPRHHSPSTTQTTQDGHAQERNTHRVR